MINYILDLLIEEGFRRIEIFNAEKSKPEYKKWNYDNIIKVLELSIKEYESYKTMNLDYEVEDDKFIRIFNYDVMFSKRIKINDYPGLRRELKLNSILE